MSSKRIEIETTISKSQRTRNPTNASLPQFPPNGPASPSNLNSRALRHAPKLDVRSGEAKVLNVMTPRNVFNLSKAEKDLAWLGEKSIIHYNNASTTFDWEYIFANAPPELKTLLCEKSKNSRFGTFKTNDLVRLKAKEAFIFERSKARETLKRNRKDSGGDVVNSPGVKNDVDHTHCFQVWQARDQRIQEACNTNNFEATLDTKNYRLPTSSREEGSENNSISTSNDNKTREHYFNKNLNASPAVDLLESEIELAWLGEESILAQQHCNTSSNADFSFDWDFICRHASGQLQKSIQKNDKNIPDWRQNYNRITYFIRTKIKSKFYFLREEIRHELSRGYRRERTRRFLPPPTITSVPKPVSAQLVPPDHMSLLPPSTNTTKKRKRSQLDVLVDGKKHSVGDRVYACWQPSSTWCPGVVQGIQVKKYMGGNREIREYDIMFENGNRDPALDEVFVMAKEDWTILGQKQLKSATQYSSSRQTGSAVDKRKGGIGYPYYPDDNDNNDRDDSWDDADKKADKRTKQTSILPDSPVVSGTEETNKFEFKEAFRCLQRENARLKSLVQSRDQDLSKLKEKLATSEQSLNRYKVQFESIKSTLERTQLEAVASRERERELKSEVAEWIEKLTNVETKLKEERRSRNVVLKSIQTALEESKSALI